MLIPLLLSWITQRTFVRNPEITLKKPAFQPPGYVFGIVWTLLYLLFGAYLRALLLRNKGFDNSQTHVLLTLWTINMVLNLSWSSLVFVHKRYVIGLYVSFGILFTLLTMMVMTDSTQLKLLLLPYMTWMILAILLNVELINRNDQRHPSPHYQVRMWA